MKKVVLPLAITLGLSVGYNAYQMDTVNSLLNIQKTQSIKITKEENEIVGAQREISLKTKNEQNLNKHIHSLETDVAKLEKQVTKLKKLKHL